MFDYHVHSFVSSDGKSSAKDIALAAKEKGLKEICFTDHFDYNSIPDVIGCGQFEMEDYKKAYDNLEVEGLSIKKGVEFGIATWNKHKLEELLAQYDFDFVIGSAHFADGFDPYHHGYWERVSSKREAFEKFLLNELECVKVHDNFDVLGHLTYVCKSEYNPDKKPLYYKDYTDICDEIMKELAKKGKGMEINTSGVDRAGAFLPSKEFFVRFKELGGEIVTVGSDAHDVERIGQYSEEALEILKDTFGYVCTFEKRKPIFNKL